MIVVISMSTPEGYEESNGSGGPKRRFEKLTGWPVATVHYTEDHVPEICPI